MDERRRVLVLGVDGMDPCLAKHLMDEGKMPNLKKYVERGSARKDLVLLGAHPTVTPPMWTTLATGAYPMTHGITDFHNRSHDELDTTIYSFDSRLCKAEQMWNVTAEAGLKTLVFHWPGSSWPPTSESENLYVVDGLTPGGVNMGSGVIDKETILVAAENIKEIIFKNALSGTATGAGCIIEDLDLESDGDKLNEYNAVGSNELRNIQLCYRDGEGAVEVIAMDIGNSPLRPAEGWADAPEGSKEFYVMVSGGLIRRPGLLLRDENGIYNQFRLYKQKNQKDLLLEMSVGEDVKNYVDTAVKNGENMDAVRNVNIVECAEDGSLLSLWISNGMDIHCDTACHPKTLFNEIQENAGYVPAFPNVGGMRPKFVDKALLPGWEYYTHWQDRAMHYLIDAHDFDVVFSHIHNVDICNHMIERPLKKRPDYPELDPLEYQRFMERLYADTDRYLGTFLPYLDEGWTIFIVSDHGGLCSREDFPPLLGDGLGVNVRVLEALGYTALKKDAEGNDLKEIDWEHTKAIGTRAAYIWLNLKGRDKHGIVDPADKYDLEGEIIDALYQYRDPATGKRVVNIAIRRKEAVLLGMDSDECGDIIYFVEEGFNRTHGDSLSTTHGEAYTSVSPIFIAAGKGIKENYVTDRVIRQVDVTPTIAEILHLRKPRQCEGAPVYQILEG